MRLFAIVLGLVFFHQAPGQYLPVFDPLLRVNDPHETGLPRLTASYHDSLRLQINLAYTTLYGLTELQNGQLCLLGGGDAWLVAADLRYQHWALASHSEIKLSATWHWRELFSSMGMGVYVGHFSVSGFGASNNSWISLHGGFYPMPGLTIAWQLRGLVAIAEDGPQAPAAAMAVAWVFARELVLRSGLEHSHFFGSEHWLGLSGCWQECLEYGASYRALTNQWQAYVGIRRGSLRLRFGYSAHAWLGEGLGGGAEGRWP
jgi:hypothetical protein